MNMTEKLRQDLKRIFHGADPLAFIEDARIVETSRHTDAITYCEVVLRVPTATEAAYKIYCDGQFWPDNPLATPKHPNCKCSQKKLDPMEAVGALMPTKVIYSGPKTIAFWPDGTKTIVTPMAGEKRDDYAAFCACVVKKMFGATHKAKKFLESVAVRPEPKEKKEKYEQMEIVPTTEEVDNG